MSFVDILKFRKIKRNQVSNPQVNNLTMYYNTDLEQFEYKDSNGIVKPFGTTSTGETTSSITYNEITLFKIPYNQNIVYTNAQYGGTLQAYAQDVFRYNFTMDMTYNNQYDHCFWRAKSNNGLLLVEDVLITSYTDYVDRLITPFFTADSPTRSYIVECYFKYENNDSAMSKISAKNLAYSVFTCNRQEKKFPNLFKIYDVNGNSDWKNTLEPFTESVANYFGFSTFTITNGATPTNFYSLFRLPKKSSRNTYSLYNISSMDIVNSEQNSPIATNSIKKGSVIDLVDNVFIDAETIPNATGITTEAYDSIVVSVEFDFATNTATYNIEGKELAKNKDYLTDKSFFRIYAIRSTDLRYYYFMVKPLGMDYFNIPFSDKNNLFMYLYGDNKKSKIRNITASCHLYKSDDSYRIGQNLKYQVRKSDFYQHTVEQKRLKKSHVYDFKFFYLENGYASNFTPRIKTCLNRKGFKLMYFLEK